MIDKWPVPLLVVVKDREETFLAYDAAYRREPKAGQTHRAAVKRESFILVVICVFFLRRRDAVYIVLLVVELTFWSKNREKAGANEGACATARYPRKPRLTPQTESQLRLVGTN